MPQVRIVSGRDRTTSVGEVRCGRMPRRRCASLEGHPGSPPSFLADGSLVKLRQAQQDGMGFLNAQEKYERNNLTDLMNKQAGNEQGQRARTTHTTGAWDISKLSHKEPESVEFVEQHRINIMGLSDCIRKGNNLEKTYKNYVKIWNSGTNPKSNI